MNYVNKYSKYKNKYLELKEHFGGTIGERAKYEYNVYNYCNTKINSFIKNNKDTYKYITSICIKTVYDFMNELYTTNDDMNKNNLDNFVSFYNLKSDNIVLTGGIKIEELVARFKKYISHNNQEYRKKFYNSLNIRSSMTLLDIIVKFIIQKSDSFKKISDFFDNHIRLRSEHQYIDNNYDRDELCLNNMHVPYGKFAKKKDCLKMVDVFEPYSKLEKNKYSENDFKNKFDVGSNKFTAPKQNFTIDVFAAGFSGHTFDILLLMTIFVFNKIEKKNIFLLVYGCLIWMLNFYHHSLREIVSIALIFIENKDYEEKIFKLFKNRDQNIDSNYEFKIIDEVFEMLEKNIRISFDEKYVETYPMIGNNTLFKTLLLSKDDNHIKSRIKSIGIKNNIIRFLNSLYTVTSKLNLNLELPL